MNPELVVWSGIAAMGIADGVLLPIYLNPDVIRLCGIVLVVSLIVGLRSANVARVLRAIVQFILIAQTFNRLSYALMASTPFPLADDLLSHWDSILGFDWLAWYDLSSVEPFKTPLHLAYRSIPVQVLVLCLWYGHADRGRIDELLMAVIFSLPFVLAGMVTLPGVGAWTHYGVGVEPWRDTIMALHSHTMTGIGDTMGIITFPSFHTVSAVLLTWMARRSKLFAPVLVLNGFMLASTPSQGAHYGVDVLAGLITAGVAIGLVRAFQTQPRRNGIRASITAPGGIPAN